MPEGERVIINDRVISEALRKAQTDREKLRWKHQMGEAHENCGVITDMERMLENHEFRLAVIKETFKDLRIVVNPKSQESTGLLYLYDLKKNSARLLLSNVQIVTLE